MNEAKTLRSLTRKCAAEPDPVAWLAAADLLEGQGRMKEALKWRRRGEWFTRLHGAVLMVANKQTWGRSVQCGRLLVSLTGKPRTVLFEVMYQPDGIGTAWVRRGATKGNLWSLASENDAGRRLWNERVLNLIDELSAWEWSNRAVSVREAQEAAMKVGDARTEEIVGAGGLSGATAAQLRRLVDEAGGED